MAKSKILKELANNEVPLDVALKRLLIICDDLDYKELFSWAEKELNGNVVDVDYQDVSENEFTKDFTKDDTPPAQ